MRSAVLYVVLAGAIVLLGLWSWNTLDPSDTPEQEGFHVVCGEPACQTHFVIPRADARAYPREPNGGGFKCEKCGKFSARLARQCGTCERWFPADASGPPGRSGSGCPHCATPEAAAKP